MTSRFDLVTIDTSQPDRSAAFGCAALGLHETEREDGDRWIVLSDDEGTRRIGLQRGVDRPGGVHLDLVVDAAGFDAESARLVALGAVILVPPRDMPYGRIVNLADPLGTAFDLCAYVGW